MTPLGERQSYGEAHAPLAHSRLALVYLLGPLRTSDRKCNTTTIDGAYAV